MKSEIALPELKEGGNGCDVDIRVGKADLSGEIKAIGSFFRATKDEIQFDIKDVGAVTVKQGREIIISPLPHADWNRIRFFIINAAMASVLQQRGLKVFHASAVAWKERAAIFMGNPGAGKSTIAAAMHLNGFRVLSDEIVAIDFPAPSPTSGPVVLPGLHSIRLLPKSAQYLGLDLDPEPMLRTGPEEDKRVYSALGGFLERSIPLKRIYVLKEGDGNCLESLAPQDSFLEIINNYYTIGMIRAGGAPEHLRGCTKLISTVPVKRLYRAGSLNYLFGLIELVKRDLDNEPL
ncbi:MAG: hypothetical protein PHQ34_00030 [Methanothrix sp.]|nr:hypothetical protein [Methanothrix sp.]